MLAYIVAEEDATRNVKIKINFPLLPAILKHYLHKTVSKCEGKIYKVSGYPAVKGYLMEVEFFEHDHLDVTIPLKDNTLATILFNGYQVIRANEVVKTISRNTLYHLRSDHPIVDGVGILSNEINEDWLVFIQISIKQYQNHNANLETLFAEKRGEKGYKELPKNDSALFIFNYYR